MTPQKVQTERRLSPRTNITGAVGRRPLWLRAIGTVVLFAIITALRFQVGPEFAFSILFVIPVSFSCWFISARAGLWTALLATLAMFIFDWQHRGLLRGNQVALWDLLMNAAMFLFVTFILAQVRTLYAEEQHHSRHDLLTGLLNRRAFTESLDLEAGRARRLPRPFTLVYIDLDHFKDVNDLQGHEVGDALLREVARTLVTGVRNVDVVARIGGDEFMMLLPETGADAARAAVGKVQQRLREMAREKKWPISSSIGAVTLAAPMAYAEEMITLADSVMYEAKQSGRDKAVFRERGA